MTRVDLHNHLGRGGSNPGFDETIDLAYSRLGDKGVFGIADSDDFRYENFINQRIGKYGRVSLADKRAIYVPEKKTLVVKCQEIFTENESTGARQGDVLAVLMPYEVNVKTKDTKDAIRTAHHLGASLVAVHPFYKYGIGNFLRENQKFLPYFSSWEIFNGSAEFSFPGILPRNANEKALEFYVLQNLSELKDIGISAFTDGHSARVIGTCYTEIPLFFEPFTDLTRSFDSALRKVKSMDKLCMEPNKRDSASHAFNMVLVKAGLRKDA